jgi:hypothetical protein
MRESTTALKANSVNSAMQTLKLESKAKPFAAHFTTKLEGVNSKLVCALSAVRRTCSDDHIA